MYLCRVPVHALSGPDKYRYYKRKNVFIRRSQLRTVVRKFQ